MNHRIPLFLRFLRSVLFVVLSWQSLCVVPLALPCTGCAAQQLEAPSQMTQPSHLTLESLHERNPQALATTICVLPDHVPPGTKFLLADAKRTTFVSDQNRAAFERFLPLADTIFELNPFARSSSAALLGKAANLSCPDTFTVTHSREEIANGAQPEQLVVRISTDVHLELSSIVEQTCKTAALERTNRLYVGQQTGKNDIILVNAVDPPTLARIRTLLGIERIPEPEPSKPKPSGPKPVLRQLMDTPQGEAVGGLAGGTIIALAPGGTIAADLAIEAHLLSPGTRNGRIGRAGGELCVGIVQVVVGCAGIGVGTGMTGTGGGAPAGVPILVGSLGLTATGAVNCGNGFRHLAVELWRADDSDVVHLSGSRAQVGSSEPTTQAANPSTQSRATTPKAPETSLTVREAPVTKTQAKGKASSGTGTTAGASAPQMVQFTPRNMALAGKKHPKTGVPFDNNGYPDFRAAGVVKKEVKIKFSGDRRRDELLANKQAGMSKRPTDHTWHHHQDGETMQLVPTDIHRQTGHSGGFAGSK